MERGIIYQRFPLRQVLIRRLLASSRSFELPASESTTSDSQQKPSQIPLMTERKLEPPVYCASVQTERHAWLESLKPYSQADSLIGMVDLHPDIFAVFPRIDLVHKNLYWQAHYRMVDWRCITTRAELPYRSRRKPWPQKGTGKARHGNRRTHIWLGGGQCKGPRGPESFFYMLPRAQRIAGLLSMLSIKHAQDDLHIVDNFDLSEPIELQAQAILDEIPSLLNPTELALDDASFESIKSRSYRLSKALNESALYLRNLVDSRRWGPSVLFVTEHTPSYDPTELSKNLENLSLDPTTYPNLGISFACNAYAHHVRVETSQEAAITLSHTISPRTTHPGRGLTLMPLQSLNVWSMVHHDTLVLSLGCLERLEQLLLKAQRSIVPDKHLDPPYLQPDPSEWTLDDEYGQQLDESC